MISKSLFSNLIAFYFQNLSVWTELHSKQSDLIYLWYFSKELSTLILLYKIIPVYLIEFMSYSSLMLPFSKVSIILSNRLSIIN